MDGTFPRVSPIFARPLCCAVEEKWEESHCANMSLGKIPLSFKFVFVPISKMFIVLQSRVQVDKHYKLINVLGNFFQMLWYCNEYLGHLFR